MTKAQLIEKHGLEWYEQFKAKSNAHWKEQYNNNPEFRETQKARCKERYNNDSKFRESKKIRCKERSKERYNNDSEFRESKKSWCKEHYQNDSEYRESRKTRCKERYKNDSKFRESMKTRIRTRYVEDGHIDLIDNYELAVKDNFNGWHIHHRLELHPDCTVRFTKQSLIKLDLYYNRPPAELIWLRSTEHKRMHKGFLSSGTAEENVT